MSAKVSVHCKAPLKEIKEGKEGKELSKDIKDVRKETKEAVKELKESRKEFKDVKETKELIKERKDIKELVEGASKAGVAENVGLGLGGGQGGGAVGMEAQLAQVLAALDERLSTLEAALGLALPLQGGGLDQPAQPFIGAEYRPELIGAPGEARPSEAQELQRRMRQGDRAAKRAFDNLP
jgi:immune inhibitor A